MPRKKGFIKRMAEAAEKAREMKRRKLEERRASAILPPPPTADPHQPSTSHATATTPPPPPPSTTRAPTQTLTSAMRRKIGIQKTEKEVKNIETVFLRRSNLVDIADNVACSVCFENSVKAVVVKRHLDTRVRMFCTKCKFTVFDNNAENYQSVKTKGVHVMTTILVYIMMHFGFGYSLFRRVCSYLFLRVVSCKVYKRYADLVNEMAKVKVQEALEKSRKATVEYYRTNYPERVGEDGVVNIDVSYDGSWHKRGQTSRYFFGAVIEGHVGRVIDYITLCSECEPCTKKQNLVKNKEWTQEKYNRWYGKHAPECAINYKGTSGSMEPTAAEKLWARSEGVGFRYVRFISDGDTKTFKTIRDMNNGQGPYGSAHDVVRCLRGKTQNPNVHSRVWRMCPKHKNVKMRYVDFAAAQAVSTHNMGHEESNLNKLLGLPFTEYLLKCLQTQDQRMDEPLKKKARRRLKADKGYSAGAYLK
ncbi:uncharacterized protein LOC135222050 isoform X1 [Macrobrachium nipponense]|uniref:uncharacterized protein LOC135222050 isoform X1 n=1 Tax=Macrobrachium nipponense TaxID=159736 RepID=UPI0030C7C7DB